VQERAHLGVVGARLDASAPCPPREGRCGVQDLRGRPRGQGAKGLRGPARWRRPRPHRLAKAGVDVSAHGHHCRSGRAARMEPGGAGCWCPPWPPPARRPATVTWRHQHIARIFAAGTHTMARPSAWCRDVFDGVHREARAPIEQALLDFLHEEALPPMSANGDPDLVAAGDHLLLDPLYALWMMGVNAASRATPRDTARAPGPISSRVDDAMLTGGITPNGEPFVVVGALPGGDSGAGSSGGLGEIEECFKTSRARRQCRSRRRPSGGGGRVQSLLTALSTICSRRRDRLRRVLRRP